MRLNCDAGLTIYNDVSTFFFIV